MPYEDFFEATKIKFTCWKKDTEKTLVKYNSFDDLPKHLMDELDEEKKEITLHGKRWSILNIDQDLRAHVKGIRVRIRLERKK